MSNFQLSDTFAGCIAGVVLCLMFRPRVDRLIGALIRLVDRVTSIRVEPPGGAGGAIVFECRPTL